MTIHASAMTAQEIEGENRLNWIGLFRVRDPMIGEEEEDGEQREVADVIKTLVGDVVADVVYAETLKVSS